MSTPARGVLRLSFFIFVLVLPTMAFAQIDCNQCDPYNGSCGTSCYICGIYEQDGCVAESMTYTTCGEAGRACIPSGCTPNWQETARENRGTYGEAFFWCWYGSGCTYACDHHRVDLVTLSDANHCNVDSSFWTTNVCQDYVDGGKGWSTHYEDCCSGFGPWGLDPTFTCNHYHSCY
jgi:hypothetical protein